MSRPHTSCPADSFQHQRPARRPGANPGPCPPRQPEIRSLRRGVLHERGLRHIRPQGRGTDIPEGASSGNVAQSAEHLQTPKRTLYNKLSRHAIIAKQFRG